MVTVRIFGGLGNQLFQYAIGRQLAFKNHTELVLDYYDQICRTDLDGENLTKITEVFDLPVKLYLGKTRKDLLHRYHLGRLDRLITVLYLKTRCVVSEDKGGHAFEKMPGGKNLYLIGYWQSERYFAQIKNIIRKEYSFKIQPRARGLGIYQEIAAGNSVGVHVRGKDYLVNPIYRRCDVRYYLQAIDMIRRARGDLRIFIFTDDVDHVRRHFQPLLEVSEIVGVQTGFKPDVLDLLLMSRCKHQVISNSSFSWWGAWLNDNPDKMVIAPRQWFIHPDYSSAHLVPAGWRQI